MHSKKIPRLLPAIGLITGAGGGMLLGIAGWSAALLIVFGAGVGLVLGTVMDHSKPVSVPHLLKTPPDEEEAHRG